MVYGVVFAIFPEQQLTQLKGVQAFLRDCVFAFGGLGFGVLDLDLGG